MDIQWLGHAAFLLEGDSGTGTETGVRVVLDPYRAPDVGTYAPVDAEADIAAISHINEKYHSYLGDVRPRPGATLEVVNGLELLGQPQPRVVKGIPFTAVGVWENDEREEPIAMVGLTLDGVRILHMGDCGHALSPEEVAACGPVDVLLALAGAGPTIALPDLVDFIHALKPRVVIPMHFLNEKINLKLRPVADFVALMPPDSVRHVSGSSVSFTPDTLPETTTVYVLEPAR